MYANTRTVVVTVLESRETESAAGQQPKILAWVRRSTNKARAKRSTTTALG